MPPKVASLLSGGLSSLYFVNSGAEAIEGALKLAKRYTGRTELVSMRRAYHGSTHGSMSMMGAPEGEEWKGAFRPPPHGDQLRASGIAFGQLERPFDRFGARIDEIETRQFFYTPEGKRYYDLVAGVSVSNVGHCNPAVVKAVQEQAARYMHVMVYGSLGDGEVWPTWARNCFLRMVFMVGFRICGREFPWRPSPPMLVEVARAEGSFFYTPEGKRYYDLVAGVSVTSSMRQSPTVSRTRSESM